jgi:hypothetical protein
MATKTEIEIVIGSDGKVTLKTSGLKGATCMSETESLEKLIGRVTARHKTREFYEQATRTRATSRQR